VTSSHKSVVHPDLSRWSSVLTVAAGSPDGTVFLSEKARRRPATPPSCRTSFGPGIPYGQVPALFRVV
jgi:hypothetical protein